MSTSSSHLQGTLHTLLTFHISEVEVEGILMLIELTTGVDIGGFVTIVAIKKADDVSQILHPKDVKLVDDSCFASILLGNNKAFELLLSGTDGYRQGASHRFELSVESQFTYHHKLR